MEIMMFLHRYIVEGIARICSDLFFGVKNLESGLCWLDSVMVALVHRSLPEGVSVEEPHRPCSVMSSWCR